ncbi:hypothetical protein [Streptomyces sp. P9(2023)]|uniref:hypothetical protein n=1 Tax=Streptomyces sp. P9(2023) TaxID=3064394 RepID=UPI0037DDA093
MAYGPRREPAGDLLAAHAADRIEYGRWWSPEELAAAEDALWPPDLADLLARFRDGGAGTA